MQNTEARKTMTCPMNGKLCIEGRREDFHRDENDYPVQCRWWVHLYGKDPQTEKVLDQYDCSVAWLPVTTIETSQSSRFAAASVDKLANEVSSVRAGMDRVGRGMIDMLNAFLAMAEKTNQLLENKNVLEIPTNGHESGEGGESGN